MFARTSARARACESEAARWWSCGFLIEWDASPALFIAPLHALCVASIISVNMACVASSCCSDVVSMRRAKGWCTNSADVHSF